jgi:hypothetical protein
MNNLHNELCLEHHDILVGGHFERERTTMTLGWRYYWPRMSRTVATYVRGYDICHRVKLPNEKLFGELE